MLVAFRFAKSFEVKNLFFLILCVLEPLIIEIGNWQRRGMDGGGFEA